MRRQFIALLLVLLVPGLAVAQSYPSKTVRLISGVTPGSVTDTMARILAEKLPASLGQPVIVENRLGAGGIVGAASVARAEPDGHLISIYASAFTVSTLINPGLDPKELTPVATIATMPTVIVVSPEKGYKTLADLVAAGKAKPGSLVATTAGVGSATHMHLERFRFAAGIEVLTVHMKGAPEALGEVLAGRADFYFAPVFAVLKRVQDGSLVALGNASPKRSALMPDLPTTVELGYPNSDYNFWVGALVSSKTPRPIVERLNREFNAAVQAPDVRDRLVKLGADPLTMSLPDFEAMIQRELVENAQLIKAAGIKAN
ncbi:MAG TPA: tripartite tricarboxylate transporter substrate-binding protein [Burkholderiales bacterium]|nr:tripartite tricarboxylate transporter substrate-binding protein [Burkholderiales bacterium]